MNKYSNTMFYDETKLTMISVEMNYNQYFSSQLNNMNTFKNAQKKLVTDLNSIIKDEKLNNILKVVATTIATDIENIKVGKNLGAQRAVDWLKKRNIFPKKYITFGDSNSDFAMADHLNKIGVNVEHVHVGKETDIPQKLPYNLIVTTSKYNDGVKEYLRNF